MVKNSWSSTLPIAFTKTIFFLQFYAYDIKHGIREALCEALRTHFPDMVILSLYTRYNNYFLEPIALGQKKIKIVLL